MEQRLRAPVFFPNAEYLFLSAFCLFSEAPCFFPFVETFSVSVSFPFLFLLYFREPIGVITCSVEPAVQYLGFPFKNAGTGPSSPF